MLEDINAWLTFAGVLVTNVGTWVVSQRKNQSELKAAVESARLEAQSAHVEHRGPEWEAFVSEMKGHFESRLAAQDQKISEQGKQIVSLTGQVASLHEHVADFRVRYRAALTHIGVWRGHHPETVALIKVPPEIADDLE